MEIIGLIGLIIVAVPVLFVIIVLMKGIGFVFGFMLGVVVRFFFYIIAFIFFASFAVYLLS